MNNISSDIAKMRREYALKTLLESEVNANPLIQFSLWLQESIDAQAYEPNAMTLATCDAKAQPSARIVLLKAIEDGGFVFFSNYDSRKGQEIDANPLAALVFIWHELERQVRVEGCLEKISASESDSYFKQRPEKSKLGAWVSPQSKTIAGRDFLESQMQLYKDKFCGQEIPRPPHWGGYILRPHKIEFWQGRSSRLHDRIEYAYDGSLWSIRRLAP
ncbi:pyridoxine 5'-phosphate oxidase [Bacteroidales bacterium]|nr:pyridoxine 5'-phosphate oxidase [Bacteroidales bacterium]